MSSYLPSDQLNWVGIRFLDPSGRIFRFEGEYYRAIYPTQVSHVRQMFESGLIEKLVTNNLLIPSEITNLKVDGYGLVLHHRRIPFVLRRHEWIRPALLDAARTFLELNLELNKHGLGTVDAHLANYGQTDLCRPVWLDLGSITKISSPAMGISEFRACLGNPLQMMAAGKTLTKTARSLMRSGGVPDPEFEALGFPRARPSIAGGNVLYRHLESFFPASREKYLRRELSRLPSKFRAQNSQWADYHRGNQLPANYDDRGARALKILELIRRFRPQRVIDLASNAGFFAFMAARQGAEVLALDYDDGAIEALYHTARSASEPLKLTVAWGDVTESWEVPVQADLVLALALTHHLALGQKFPFSFVAKKLASYCSQTLITEFMPNGLGINKPNPAPLPDWYSLENFLYCLGEVFESVAVVDYPLEPSNSPRTLIVCRGPKQSGDK